TLAARVQAVELRMLLVGVEVAGQLEMLQALDALLLDPQAGVTGRLRHHVLSGRIAGREVEAQEPELAYRVLLDVAQLTVVGGLLGLGLDGVEVAADPLPKGACSAGIAEDEARRALHHVVD